VTNEKTSPNLSAKTMDSPCNHRTLARLGMGLVNFESWRDTACTKTHLEETKARSGTFQTLTILSSPIDTRTSAFMASNAMRMVWDSGCSDVEAASSGLETLRSDREDATRQGSHFAALRISWMQVS
jgi:hypothetical protein